MRTSTILSALALFAVSTIAAPVADAEAEPAALIEKRAIVTVTVHRHHHGAFATKTVHHKQTFTSFSSSHRTHHVVPETPELTPELPPVDDSSVSSQPSDSNLDSTAQSILDEHNKFRAMHGVSPLTWNSDLASFAESHASSCVFEHTNSAFGENLAAGFPSAAAAVESWYNEISDYDFNFGDFSEVTGHFTQVVWAASSEIGCAYVSCNTRDTPGNFLMCEYQAAGNVIGEFSKNVFPAI